MKTLHERVSRIYTPLDEAAALLHERRATQAVRPANQVEALLAQRPCAVLFRQIATPNFELLRFLALASAQGLTPVVLEFHQDLFVDRNPAKLALGKMRFHDGWGKNGGPRLKTVTVMDVNSANGRPLCEARTRWGRSLAGFHHDLLVSHGAWPMLTAHDASVWFRENGGSARRYYTAFFELLINLAVLIESFPITGHDAAFTREVMLPSFEASLARQGSKPLVCRLDPPDAEGDPYWLQYPGNLFAVVERALGSERSQPLTKLNGQAIVPACDPLRFSESRNVGGSDS